KQCIDGEIDDPGLAAYAETGIWVTRVPSMEEDHITYPDLPDLLEIMDKRDGTMAIKSDYRDLIVSAKDRMVRSDRWKLVHLPMNEGISRRLFDLDNDPTCLKDVSAIYPEAMAEMSALLEKWMAEDTRMQPGGLDAPS
ncbi:MAG: arylsulfatase, partial [Sulfurimicrobium sp.]|nr:arylsulfatase [Sulfurimicrobium sp.]